ncbi:MAG: TraR/DksA family transcriptional regulator [Alphaproteobacteria bacterium]|nr:TraR/DksA family transcriptional regulator [Alphaproteobacteria bacterium]
MSIRKSKIAEEIVLDPKYKPTKKEEYMNPMMLQYFREKLLRWKAELVKESEALQREIIEETESTYGTAGDEVDRANDEAIKQLELRTKDRERKLIAQIDMALDRVEKGTYGYSEISGEPIGLVRLEAKPTAKYTIEEQEEHESQEKLRKK